MTSPFLATALLFGLTAAASAAVDPHLLALSLPDAKMLAGVQLTESKNSPFGQFLLTQAAITAPQLDQVKTLTGFDPRTDLSEVVVSSGGNGKGFLAARGVFQPARISNLAAASGTSTTVHHGIYIIAGPRETGAAAFLDGTTVIVGEKAQVEAAIDRWISGALASGPLVKEAQAGSGSSHAWMVASDLTSLLPAQPASAPPPSSQAAAMSQNLLKIVSQISGGVHFGDTQITVRGKALAASEQDAKSLADVLRFASSMLLAPKPGLPAIVPTISSSGNAVEFSASLEEHQAESLFQLRPGTLRPRLQASVRR